MIGICTDSNAQLPAELRDRYGIEVVPLSVTVDGVDHLEGVDLDADAFYARFTEDHRPEVTTAAPSPGRFAAAYAGLVARGATEILSVHIGSALSGTLSSARLAAAGAGVPVRLVDTGSASFVVASAAWAAAEAVAAGAGLEEAAAAAESVAGRCGNVFVVGTLELAERGGRLAPRAGADQPAGIPVLELVGGRMQTVGSASSPEQAAAIMRDAVLAGGSRLRVGVAVSDESSVPVADALVDDLAGDERVAEVVRYRVGPSVGAHTGPGTAGAVFYSS